MFPLSLAQRRNKKQCHFRRTWLRFDQYLPRKCGMGTKSTVLEAVPRYHNQKPQPLSDMTLRKLGAHRADKRQLDHPHNESHL